MMLSAESESINEITFALQEGRVRSLGELDTMDLKNYEYMLFMWDRHNYKVMPLDGVKEIHVCEKILEISMPKAEDEEEEPRK